mmetsp:Transcript_26868/g.79174  ORF Transcript_26868/g.79174 Transcript_26868/m.79174 type:complete len:253 (-) Transcript_26868:534-1292(-)
MLYMTHAYGVDMRTATPQSQGKPQHPAVHAGTLRLAAALVRRHATEPRSSRAPRTMWLCQAYSGPVDAIVTSLPFTVPRVAAGVAGVDGRSSKSSLHVKDVKKCGDGVGSRRLGASDDSWAPAPGVSVSPPPPGVSVAMKGGWAGGPLVAIAGGPLVVMAGGACSVGMPLESAAADRMSRRFCIAARSASAAGMLVAFWMMDESCGSRHDMFSAERRSAVKCSSGSDDEGPGVMCTTGGGGRGCDMAGGAAC